MMHRFFAAQDRTRTIIRQFFFIGILFSQPLWSQSMNTAATSTPKNEPATVAFVDLSKYIGAWYEIARIPNRFEKESAYNITATYGIRNDGKIDVVNRCLLSDGTVSEAKGIARVADTATHSKLEVSFVRIFGLQLFWGDYWIIGLDKEYRYAVIGSPTRKYGWILSRTPSLSKDMLSTIFEILRTQGYDPQKFIYPRQKP
jgi:apolipoprotein D and lipocalin family protein